MTVYLSYLWVAVGGAFGSALRFGIGRFAQAVWPNQGFPWATLAINLLGCFLMGCLVQSLAQGWVAQRYQPLLGVGILGGFTTFSTFSLEAVLLWQRGDNAGAMLYVLLSVLGGLAGFIGGMTLLRGI